MGLNTALVTSRMPGFVVSMCLMRFYCWFSRCSPGGVLSEAIATVSLQCLPKSSPCIRLIEMTHELHTLGYQQIRIFLHGTVRMLLAGGSGPASAFRSSVEPPSVESERELVRYSSGSGWKP